MRFLVRAFFFLRPARRARRRRRLPLRRPPARTRRSRSTNRTSTSASRRPLDVVVTAPGATLSKLPIVLDQGGTQTPIYTQGDTTARRRRVEGDRIRHQPGHRQARPCRRSSRARPGSSSPPRARCVRDIRDAGVDRHARRPGPARAAARVGGLDAPLHQPRRHGDGRLSRHARTTSSPACWSATSSIPATRERRQGRGRVDHRPVAARGVLSRCSTTRTSTRRCALFARDEAGNTARADFDFT